MRSYRHVLLAAGLCGLLVVLLAAVDIQPAAAATPNVLFAGHRLVARTANHLLSSPSSEFQLDLEPDHLDLDQYAPLNGPKGPDTTGTGLWFRDDPTGKHQSSTDHTVLALSRNGNLVLRTSKGYVLWSTHTKGSGTQNRLVLRDNGTLAMYTARNRKVWSSRTTGVLLPAGRELRSGQRLRDMWGDQQGGVPFQLIMQRSGDLQYRCASRVLWHTRTGVRGSFAALRRDGNFVVYSPSKKVLWSTHTAGSGSYTWLNAGSMTLYNTNFRKLWHTRTFTEC